MMFIGVVQLRACAARSALFQTYNEVNVQNVGLKATARGLGKVWFQCQRNLFSAAHFAAHHGAVAHENFLEPPLSHAFPTSLKAPPIGSRAHVTRSALAVGCHALLFPSPFFLVPRFALRVSSASFSLFLFFAGAA